MSVTVTKKFTFEAAHQLVGHNGQCANIHGHSYIMEVSLKGKPKQDKGASDEAFVMDFTDLKRIVKEEVVDKLDHSFIAKGDEPALPAMITSGTKVVQLGFRSTVENMAQYICWKLYMLDVPVESIKIWETATGSATVRIEDLIEQCGPKYNKIGSCDLD